MKTKVVVYAPSVKDAVSAKDVLALSTEGVKIMYLDPRSLLDAIIILCCEPAEIAFFCSTPEEVVEAKKTGVNITGIEFPGARTHVALITAGARHVVFSHECFMKNVLLGPNRR